MKTSLALMAFLAVLSGGILMIHAGCSKDPVAPTDPPTNENLDGYIDILGEVPETVDFDSTTIVESHDEERDGEVWRCTTANREFSLSYPEWPQFAGNDWCYPGQVIQAASILNASPDIILLPRGPASICIDNVNGATVACDSCAVSSLTCITNAQNTIIRSQPSDYPASLYLSVNKFKTREELQLLIYANASYFGLFGGSTRWEISENQRVSHFLVALIQSYYTMRYEPPLHPSQFWAEGVTSADLERFSGENNPPVYISSVTYGRMFLLLIETVQREETAEGTIRANFLFGSAGSEVNYLTQLESVRIQAAAWGGNADDALLAIQSGLGSLGSFLGHLRDGGAIEQAKPLSFSARSVRSGRLVRNAVASAYGRTDCSFVSELCTPAPLHPVNYESVDNGCRRVNNLIRWDFSWTPCSGAATYHVRAGHPQLGDVFNDSTVTRTTFSATFTRPFETLLNGWTWEVRAKTGGLWGEWSRPQTFRIEPLNSDCATGVTLFQDLCSGNRLWVTRNIPDLRDVGFNDRVSALRLSNIRGVWLYEHSNYGGRYIYKTADDCDLRNDGFDNRASSVKIDW